MAAPCTARRRFRWVASTCRRWPSRPPARRPPTGPSPSSASLARGSNTLTFGALGTAPDIDAVAVRAVPGTNGTAVVGTGIPDGAGLLQEHDHQQQPGDLWDCGVARTMFTYTSRGDGGLRQQVLDAYSGTANGTKVVLWDCNGGTNVDSTPTEPSPTTSRAPGLTGRRDGERTLIDLWSCNGGSNQQWTCNGTVPDQGLNTGWRPDRLLPGCGAVA